MQPRQLGRYRICEELGHGAMGRVFLAHDPEIDRKVALKTIQIFADLPESRRAEARERFLCEARAAGKLSHPGIVTLHDVGQTDELLYLAMELVEGESLAVNCAPDNLLPVRTVLEMLAGVADALAFAHAAGVVHRDIKPANLMRVGEMSTKIMDFGLAGPAMAELGKDSGILGTPAYMSPEQIRNAAVDGRSDLFSLGVVLFELLTGRRPFQGDSIPSVIYRIVNEPPPDPVLLSDRVSSELGTLLQRALAKRPEDRFTTGDEMAAALRRAADIPVEVTSVSIGTPPPAGQAKPRSSAPAPKRAAPPRSSAMPYLIGAVVLLVAIAAGAYGFRDRLGLSGLGQPAELWWETSVRTEPQGLEVLLEGVPLDPAAGGVVRFKQGGPFGMLVARLDCRTTERRLEPGDAAGEIVLVLDPVDLVWRLDPGVAGATARLNGEALGQLPVDLQLDLCRDNRLEIAADGHRPFALDIPAGASAVAGRSLLTAVTLDPIPTGVLSLSDPPAIDVVFYVDGNRLRKDERQVELLEGAHRVRLKNEYFWIDVTHAVEVRGGENITPRLPLPPLTELVVQAFPPNCKVHLRRPGGRWKYIDETPLRRKVATGRYEVRVTFTPTGEIREQPIELAPGDNPPLRFAFGKTS